MISPSERQLVGYFWEVIAYDQGKRRGPVTAPYDKHITWASMTAFASRTLATLKAAELTKRAEQSANKDITYRVVKVTRWARA